MKHPKWHPKADKLDLGTGTCPVCDKYCNIDWSKPTDNLTAISVPINGVYMEVCSAECARKATKK